MLTFENKCQEIQLIIGTVEGGHNSGRFVLPTVSKFEQVSFIYMHGIYEHKLIFQYQFMFIYTSKVKDGGQRCLKPKH